MVKQDVIQHRVYCEYFGITVSCSVRHLKAEPVHPWDVKLYIGYSLS